MAPSRRAEIARAFAHAVDAKSAFTLNHSIGVAGLVERAAAEIRISARRARGLRVPHRRGRARRSRPAPRPSPRPRSVLRGHVRGPSDARARGAPQLAGRSSHSPAHRLFDQAAGDRESPPRRDWQEGDTHHRGCIADGSVAAYFRLVEEVREMRRTALAAAGGSDLVVITPPCPLPAYHHGACLEVGTLGTYTTYWNVLGWPAGVIPWTEVRAGEESDRPASKDPCHVTARKAERDSIGLPIGVQIAAPPHRDHVALAVMRALEPSRSGVRSPLVVPLRGP
jgi:hypothetical protein